MLYLLHPLTVTPILAFLVILFLLKIAPKSFGRTVALMLLSILILIPIAVWAYIFIGFLPSFFETNFTKTCRSLDGQDFTVENLSKLGGRCFEYKRGIGFWPCDTENLSEQIKRVEDKKDHDFTIIEKGLEDSWACNIFPIENGKMKTKPIYGAD
jgi:hypothetical protein